MQDANLPAENQAAEVPSASPNCLTMEEEWGARIRPHFSRGNTLYIAGWAELAEAKRDLKKRGGSFIALVEVQLEMDLGTVERQMKIARNPVLADSAHAPNLPISWMTLYVLASLPLKVLEGFIKDGTNWPQA